ncbi:CrcB family protein [Oceanobacillus piezotolerans]|uniref:Fluoride-specific ion channel FluC n=1 Tax=Oceanobacillus piezotolerans TaxID=2448030 RepID=A0A498DA11_9BACI|nr:CrcB family protein [Oceanobacillus piezotolerans]RLL45471.1 CrcB family protein [Oceanobacillus piezotolerans]
MTFLHIFIVGAGGFLGAIGRFSISKHLNKKTLSRLPIGTLTVNLTGAFLLGIITGIKADIFIALLFGTGFLGAFTTFSTVKLELTRLYIQKRIRLFIFYLLITYGFGIILAYFGYFIGTILFSLK